MFRSARLKLTIVYCLIFFAIFWLFSAGLYLWMERSFGEGYVSQVQSQQGSQTGNQAFDNHSKETATIAGNVAFHQLGRILLLLNGLMVVVIPGLAWLLTARTLRPIEATYNRQNQFVSDASHELRTPLTIMQAELDLALRQTRLPQEYRATIQSARQEVARLHELTEALLFIARQDHQPIQLTEPVDITDVLTEVVCRLQPLADAKQQTIQFEPPPAMRLSGSSSMLQQLFTNLLDNAIKFSPNGGRIVIICDLSDKQAVIRIIDSGPGMSRLASQMAFERFYRADSARSQRGFGLGLPICKAIVDQHGGSINLSSAAGQGTTVTVNLPRN